MSQEYQSFLASKSKAKATHSVCECAPIAPLKSFQSELVNRALTAGRYALFADTGLGKTLMQLMWAQHVIDHHGPALILTPLAVREQTQREAAKFGVAEDAEIINYDQLHNVDVDKYAGVVLDESSILKNFTGKTRTALIDAFSDTPFRLACTATPAPNDHTELGNHSQFLGVMPRHEMLSEYFVHDGGSTQNWRLKGHAIKPFWQWVSQWASVVRHPRDLGAKFDEPGYDLPELIERTEWVDGGDISDLADVRGIRAIRRKTLTERAERIAEMVNGSTALVWCDYNDESATIASMIDGAVEVRGDMHSDEKAERMLAFADGEVRVLVTKPKIAGFGMNWQHCNQVYFAGPSHSFEQRYQSIRRCWRFGQKRPVSVTTCATNAEQTVLKNQSIKQANHEDMTCANGS